MHIEIGKFLTLGGRTLDTNGRKALKLRLTGAEQCDTGLEKRAGWNGNQRKLTLIFDF